MFTRNKLLKGRSLWSLSQGKRSVGTYYDEIVTLGRSVYSDMPDQYKDMVLRDAVLNELIKCSNRSNILPSEALP